MFSQLPYPRSEAPVSPERALPIRPSKWPARICVVADSSGTDTHLWSGLASAGDDACLLDLALTTGIVPAKMATTRLRDLYVPRHDFTPLISLCVYHWLARQSFDLVVFVGVFGVGYYSVVAKDLGLAFKDTILAVVAEASHAYSLEAAHRFPHGRTDIELDFLERQTVRRADVLISGREEFSTWCVRAGWELPRTVLTGPGFPLDRVLDCNRLVCPSAEMPFISVCLPTHNRPALLEQAVASLVRQTYPHFEVILVDDGSTDPEVATCLAGLSDLFQMRDWTIIRQSNAGVSAARNAAARVARGSYLLFMDDDNIALGHEIERFAVAAAASGADIITCIPGHHPETDMGPDAVAELSSLDPDHPLCGVDWTPVGASLSLVAMVNCLGDCNALYKRSMFEALGGFQGSPLSSFEDFRFLMLAVVRGYRLEVLPEILFLYRRHQNSRSMRDALFHSHVDCLSPLTELVPKELWPLLLSAHRDWYDRHKGWTNPL